MPKLKNHLLQINIKSKGAELSNITSVANQTEFMWQADPTIWASHAPNLFPIIGSMKDDSYCYNKQHYKMPKHGFARHNENFKIKAQTDNSITFSLVADDTSMAIYPFLFEFRISYLLTENKLSINHTVINLDTKALYFSLGGHPAFNCPLNENEDYTDYFLAFEKHEQSVSYLLNMANGLLTQKTKSVFSDGNRIYLKPDLFNEDALIFKDLKSKSVSLTHKTRGTLLTVDFKDFKQLGIWAKPNASYVCIEPWLGIADNETTDQNIETKEGILKLEAGASFEASYSIEIEQGHLV